MNCDEARKLFTDYWNRALIGDEEIAVETHLGSCESCRADADRLGSLWRDLALIPEEQPRPALRHRFYESLSAYQQGLNSAPRRSWRSVLSSLWPKQPAWQMAAGFALLVAAAVAGYQWDSWGKAPKSESEVAQLRKEVGTMRQLVVLSLMQQQSASERLRGVSWSYQVASSDTQVLAALIDAVSHDSNVNVRLAAVDALRSFAASPVTRNAVVEAIPLQSAPLVQIALIDLAVDLKEQNAVGKLRQVVDNAAADPGVRERANWALERLQ